MLTEAKQAQQWHDDHQGDPGHDQSSCWCCCNTCDEDNPHFEPASTAIMQAQKDASS